MCVCDIWAASGGFHDHVRIRKSFDVRQLQSISAENLMENLSQAAYTINEQAKAELHDEITVIEVTSIMLVWIVWWNDGFIMVFVYWEC